MKKINFYLTIISLFLLLIIVVEVIFYFSHKKIVVKTNLSIKNNPTPLLENLFEGDFYKVIRESYDPENRFLFPYRITNFFQGRVLEIHITGVKRNGIKFDFKLLITDKDNKKTVAFYFWKNAFPFIKTVEKINGEERPIKIEEIKTGDWVEVEDSRDLNKPLNSNLVSFKIIKRGYDQ